MSTTTTASDLHDCAVCANSTTTRCSACKSTFFCSRECQALIWPTHKWLCGKSTFFFPPFLASELWHLRETAYIPYQPGPVPLQSEYLSLVKHLKAAGVFNGTWEDLYSLLTSPSPTIPPWKHLCILAHSHVHIDNFTESRGLPESPWRLLAHIIKTLPFERYSHPDLTKPKGMQASGVVKDKNAFLERVSPLLEQYLILTTLQARQSGTRPPKKLTPDLLSLAAKRAQTKLTELRLDSWTDSSIRGYLIYEVLKLPRPTTQRVTGGI